MYISVRLRFIYYVYVVMLNAVFCIATCVYKRWNEANCVTHTYLCLYFQEVIAFQQDTSPDVRKFVVQFMEDAW